MTDPVTQMRTLLETIDSAATTNPRAGLILCTDPQPEGDIPFYVKDMATYAAYMELEHQAFNEAEHWGGMRFNVSPDDEDLRDGITSVYPGADVDQMIAEAPIVGMEDIDYVMEHDTEHALQAGYQAISAGSDSEFIRAAVDEAYDPEDEDEDNDF